MKPGSEPNGFVPASKLRREGAQTSPPKTRLRRRSRSLGPPSSNEGAPPQTGDRVPLSDFPLHPALRALLESQGLRELYPPQAEALPPILEGRSVVLACPTASGKSLVGYVALAMAALGGRRGLYVVPLRALASEKYEDLQAFQSLGLKVALTMGSQDLSPRELENVDILVATSEKADSLLRHRSPWIDTLGVLVADEIHLLRDPDRGPTLEVSLTRLRRQRPGLQIVALSATVANSHVLAQWLDAVHVQSDFRPVVLKPGVYFDGRIEFLDGSRSLAPPPGNPPERLVRTAIEEGGQALVFVNTRRSSESLAEALGPAVSAALPPEAREELARLAEDLTRTSEEETEGLRRLRRTIPWGTAFHNASLTNPERSLVEKAFRSGRIKCVVATPTLSAGINLPARRVIIRDLTRYDDSAGLNVPLPVLEVHQMCGRAGRPRYDPYGEAVLMARSSDEAQSLVERYLEAPPEPVESRLASAAVLRTHLLALVASREVSDRPELERFLGETLYGHTFSVPEIQHHLVEAESFLRRNGLLEDTASPRLRATLFGRLTSDLYLDPVSAVILRRALERARSSPEMVDDLSLLATVAATPDLAPFYLRQGEERDLTDLYLDRRGAFLVQPQEEPGELDMETFLGTLKTARVLEAWTDDRQRLLDITERHGVSAGDLRAKVERAEWLLSSMAQLARTECRPLARPLDELAVRVRYGVRRELLELVELRGIGRVRSRLLHGAGFTSLEKIRRASEAELVACLGSETLARDVLAQVRGVRKPPARSGNPEERGPSTAPPERPGDPSPPRGGSLRSLDHYPTSD